MIGLFECPNLQSMKILINNARKTKGFPIIFATFDCPANTELHEFASTILFVYFSSNNCIGLFILNQLCCYNSHAKTTIANARSINQNRVISRFYVFNLISSSYMNSKTQTTIWINIFFTFCRTIPMELSSYDVEIVVPVSFLVLLPFSSCSLSLPL